MPFGKLSKSQSAKFAPRGYKRNYNRKKKAVQNKDIGRAKRLSVVNSPLSRTLKAHLLYSTNYPITLVGIVRDPGTYVVSLNGLFKPEVNAVAPNFHQPRGFDQLMAMYDHYTVIGCKVRIDCHNNQTTVAAMVMATVRDSSTTSTDVSDYMESTNTQFKLLGIEGTGSADKQLMLNINPNQFLGRSHPLADPQLKGSATSNPDEQCFLHVSANPVDYFTNSAVTAIISLDYTVIFTEPKQPAQS